MSTETVYACTSVEKLASDWDPTEGASTHSRTILCQRSNITSDSLVGLVEAIGQHYFLDLDDLWIPDNDEEPGQINTIGYNRVETVDSDEPTTQETEQWKRGELKLYLCDYSFAIEKRTVAMVGLEEFDLAGIKHHE